MENIVYSNPRMKAVIENWPSSFSKRVTATFEIEKGKKGERAVRTTEGAPKKLTFAKMARIVDGSDGRTYIAEHNVSHITIMRGDMKFEHETLFPSNPRYAAALELFATEENFGT